MSILHEEMEKLVPRLREERRAVIEAHGGSEVGRITAGQVIGGMRHMPALLCDTSVVDPDKGLIIRGTSIRHLAGRLPEEVFFLLLTGRLPDAGELDALRSDLRARAGAPAHVWNAMPGDAHPMTMLSAAVMALDRESVFRIRYDAGIDRADYWRPALEDGLRLIALMPELAAGVYRARYGDGRRIEAAGNPDWAAAFAHMLGRTDDRFVDYLRIATIVQSDHEGGHASALTAHTVGSTLASVFYAVSAGYCALAGPLHGLASQVAVRWVLDAMERYNGVPSDDQIREYTWATLESGRVIPGYGHAVLRGQDPRYLSILAFGEKHTARSPIFKTVVKMSRVVPGVLMEQGKAKNPWPNVDAINGALFHHFGFEELPYYTVFFASALTFGFVAQYVLNRALLSPITRPRSVTTEWIKTHADKPR